MTIRVIVNGAQGKMGSLACDAIRAQPDFELVGALSQEDDLSASITNARAHIVVDLTRANCVYANSLTIINSRAHPVIGTSGLTQEQIQHLKSLCDTKKLGGIIVPNFSISAVLMMQFAAQAAKYLSDVEIIEAHHPQKFDAPSGTAMKTADMIAVSRKILQNHHLNHELVSGVRGGTYQGIAIHSLRLPGIMAKQQVIFGSTGETLTITHDSIDRISFMPGVILCCQKVSQLKTLYYGLEHLLEE